MIENKIQLEEKLVGRIEGEFYVPSYQRGYRWDESQVTALLDDVYNNKEKPYCLQPLVVRKKAENIFELIDGQQRLTTLYIIYKFMVDRWPDYIENINYSLTYETRENNVDFFNHIEDAELANANIDFFFMHRAYMTVKDWFLRERNVKPLHVAGDITKYFDNNVKVIWYELQSGTREDATKLFTRLNIGRIPLTNAELVKALFLCNTKHLGQRRQMEIALQWDTIEREMHDDDFWYFLTKKKAEEYATRIELIFDFIAGKQAFQRDPLSTFLYFNMRKEKGEDLSELWEEILRYYYRLKEWYKKDPLYHRIGYLVASGHMTMNQIVDATINLKKTEQKQLLDEEIKKSVIFKKSYSELNYVNNYDEISRLLLLFNVVSMMNHTHSRFPFRAYNTELWSLEHIHPQHPEEMKNDQKLWKEWMRIQKISIEEINTADEDSKTEKENLIAKIDNFCEMDKVTKEDFKTLSFQVVQCLSDKSEDDLTHSLSNMALLSKSHNSALNNSLFDAKRREIIEMDRKGEFIPYCTRNVFLKYYTDPKKIQMAVWSKADRDDYIAAMNKVLELYKAEEITV